MPNASSSKIKWCTCSNCSHSFHLLCAEKNREVAVSKTNCGCVESDGAVINYLLYYLCVTIPQKTNEQESQPAEPMVRKLVRRAQFSVGDEVVVEGSEILAGIIIKFDEDEGEYQVGQ
jgi:hypothetical protein